MSLRPESIESVPKQTVRVARTAFPKGNPYLTLHDQLGTIFHDEDFADLYPHKGQPALAPWRLALVTVMQFRENLADRQAAEAVRARIDWKYLLGLELTDPGFDFSVLSEFRDRLLAGNAEERLLDKLLVKCQAMGLLKGRRQQRTDSTHVLSAVRVLNQLELVAETLRATLNELATVAPEWIQLVAPTEWYERYAKRIEDARLPKEKAEREVYGQVVGEDGFALLEALDHARTPQPLRELASVVTLRQLWGQYYERLPMADSTPGTSPRGQVRLKPINELPRAAEHIESPYDLDARFRKKRGTQWSGYMTHISETCEEAEPHLLTHVETTAATVHEAMCTDAIHQALVDKELPPGEHFVDSAYVDAELLLQSRTQHAIILRGPTRPHTGWQGRSEQGYALEQFVLDWDQEQAWCPQGKTSTSWQTCDPPSRGPFSRIRFSQHDCRPCEARDLCTRSSKHPRVLQVPLRDQYEARQGAEAWFDSEAGRRAYQRRAGIEGTLSQGVRAFGLRRTRYRGLDKTHLQMVAIAAAINLDRLAAWFDGRPRAFTRTSRFAMLAPP
jgi:transposase